MSILSLWPKTLNISRPMVFKVFYQALKFLQCMKAAPDQIRKKITVTSQHLLSRVVSYDDTKIISKRFHKAPLLSVLAFRRFDTRFSLDKILFQITPTYLQTFLVLIYVITFFMFTLKANVNYFRRPFCPKS